MDRRDFIKSGLIAAAVGAAAYSWFAHLTFEVPGGNTSNEWLEPVTDEEYSRLKCYSKPSGS